MSSISDIYDGQGNKYTFSQSSEESNNFNVSKWSNKKIIVDGDSVTYLGYWSNWLKEWLFLSDVYNHAGSGMSLTWQRSGNDASGVGSGLKGYERVQQNYEEDADCIILMGDFNDAAHSTNNLGNYDDSVSYESYETGSWCARFNLMLDAIEEKYPTKPVLLIANPPRPGSDRVGLGNWGDNQIEKMKEIAQNRNLYYLDCYRENILRPNNDANKLLYTTNSDGVHLNQLGSKLMAQMIYEKMKQIGMDF